MKLDLNVVLKVCYKFVFFFFGGGEGGYVIKDGLPGL